MDISKRKLALQSAHLTAQNLMKLVARDDISKLPSLVEALSPPHLDLSFPVPDFTSLHSLGLPYVAVQRILVKMNELVQALKDEHVKNYEKNCRDLVPFFCPEELVGVLERVRQAYTISYQQQSFPLAVEKIMAMVNIVALKHQSSMEKVDKKISFNSEYTPILEKYFELNAYPCASDRQLLARKSLMTVRQIDVWFQNHRRRAKGKYLRRCPGDRFPIHLDLENLEQQLISYALNVQQKPSTEELSPESSDDEGLNQNNTFRDQASPPATKKFVDILDPPPPPHAYPTPYRQTTRSTIFSLKYDGEGYEFHPPSPLWRRRPASTSTPRSPMNFTEFIKLFKSDLQIRGLIDETTHQRTPRCWFAHRHTVPSPAPLPALIRPSTLQLISRPSTSWLKDLSFSPTVPSRKEKQSCSQSSSKYGVFTNQKRIPSTSSYISSPSTSRASSLNSSHCSEAYSSSSSSSSLSTPSTSPISSPLALPQPVNLYEPPHEFALQDEIFQSLYGSMPTLTPDLTDFPLKRQHSNLYLRQPSPVVEVYS